MVLMIIKGLCGRYERWNPVHPTTGAFWGMGIGLGCGVGWGPGFGPEVVGYVGAGCGIGFSVGITLAGIGIGLPANYVFEVPYNVLVATKSGALEIARSSCLLAARNVAGNDSDNFGVCISQIQSKAFRRFSSLRREVQLGKSVYLSDMKRAITSQTMSALDHLQRFGSHIFRRHKGLKD